MNKQDVTKALIELAVDQGMKDMKADSHRSIRRMADLGKQFARGRFQSRIFSLLQRLLSNEDSPYYEMIDQLLTHTNPEHIKRFGINIGYCGWTYGASLLRGKKSETGLSYPWFLVFPWKPDSNAGLTLQEIRSLITENCKNGTYCYVIHMQGSLLDHTEIFRLFHEFPDCAFLLELSLNGCALQNAQLEAIGTCPNLMVMLPCESPDCRPLAKTLLSQGSLFSLSFHYQDEDLDSLLNGDLIDSFLSCGSSLLCLIADKNCSPQAQVQMGEFVLNTRMQQKYPAILLEWKSDAERVNQIING